MIAPKRACVKAWTEGIILKRRQMKALLWRMSKKPRELTQRYRKCGVLIPCGFTAKYGMTTGQGAKFFPNDIRKNETRKPPSFGSCGTTNGRRQKERRDLAQIQK
jgi:hypothetical protein